MCENTRFYFRMFDYDENGDPSYFDDFSYIFCYKFKSEYILYDKQIKKTFEYTDYWLPEYR